MRAQTISTLLLIATLTSAWDLDSLQEIIQEVPRLSCSQTDYCAKTLLSGQNTNYSLDPQSLQINDASITARLASTADGTTPELDLTMRFYQNGIMRMLIEEPNSARFRISQEGLPVVDSQLEPVTSLGARVAMGDNNLTVSELAHADGSEMFSYTVEFSPFKVTQRSDELVTLVLNPQSALSVQSTEAEKAVSLGFYFPAQKLFGIPEREDTFELQNTGSDPYEIFASDVFAHPPNNKQPLYGSVPYITSLSPSHSASVTWVNSAKTWVSIDDFETGKYVNFVSEAGALELFVFASSQHGKTNRVKKVQEDLAIVSGFVPLTMVQTLGYHFCKWANVSAEMMIERNRNFTEYGFPVDVLWMDIEWADQYSDPAGYEYFKFNPQNFTEAEILQMNTEIEAAHRRITVIVDPHIKATEDYFVYANGIALESSHQVAGNLTSIFVKNSNGTNFYGDCWPGNSTWIDFLNENAQNFWAQQLSYDNFKGSSYIYSFWNDMNEPAVFNTDSHTMPMDNLHFKADGRSFQHRDLHNAYGALQQKSSWKGMLERDNHERRPFVLTRSFFLGSQKFGTFWTGDNNAFNAELQGSVNMLLQLGVAGHPFGGSDVPGFYGEPTDDLYVQFYQLGAFYPFFRAHTEINTPNREPWLQSPRVQTAIRAAINQRYDLIHYIYTSFEQTTRTAEPLMRAMWNEFPDDQATYDIYTQFMFGDSILFAPKVTQPTELLSAEHKQVIDFYLPVGATWFNYQTGAAETSIGQWTYNRTLTDLEQGIFVRGGSILPILQHDDCYALLACIDNAITLQVYLNQDGQAQGKLYLDDGETFEYQRGKLSFVDLSAAVTATDLIISSRRSQTLYPIPETKVVTRIEVNGLQKAPTYLSPNETWDGTTLTITDLSLQLGKQINIPLSELEIKPETS